MRLFPNPTRAPQHYIHHLETPPFCLLLEFDKARYMRERKEVYVQIFVKGSGRLVEHGFRRVIREPLVLVFFLSLQSRVCSGKPIQ